MTMTARDPRDVSPLEIIKVYLYPRARGEDDGQGGVRRVIEGMQSSFAHAGLELVDDARAADVIGSHISIPKELLALHPDKPIVAHCHGLYWSEYEWANWAMEANRLVLDAIKVADLTTAPSEWVAQTIRRHTSRDVEVIPHAVDLEEWSSPPSEPVAGYVYWDKTRPDPVCDPAPLNELARRMPVQGFITTFGEAASNVVVTGRVSYETAKDLMKRAGIYLATTRETFGISVLQALAAGVPVVGWKWGGQAEFLTHGFDSWLVKPGDIEGLAEGIAAVLNERERYSVNARMTARSFTWEDAADAYRAVYERAIMKRRRAPKVSVIVTAYKLEKYLVDTLDSVRKQSLADFECIVVDDASPDRCGEIADSFAASDPRFRVIHNETNQYLAAARNTGIAAARGMYVMPLDADDMLAPNSLEILAAALDRDRTIHVAYGSVEFRDEDGITPTNYGNARGPGYSGWPFPFDTERQFRGPGQVLPYASMFRWDAWHAVGGYRPRCKSSEDCDLWIRLTSYGFTPAMVTDAPTLIYRNRPDSMSRAEGFHDEIHRRWYPWIKRADLVPAGAVRNSRPEVASLDPPAVSIIIPVGPGHEMKALDAIDSVQAQTFPRWECIVVNDTGGDLPPMPTWVRVVSPKDYFLQMATTRMGQTNRFGGPAQARNAGIERASAKLFLPLDADDVLQPEALASLVDAAEKYPGEIIYSDWWEDPKAEGSYQVWPPRGSERDKDYDATDLIRFGCLHTVTALTPVEIWKAVGGYDPDIYSWEDWGFQLACAEKGYCSRRIAAPLFLYRKHTGRRRESAYTDIQQSSESIKRKFGEYFTRGGRQLMACGSCGRRASIQPFSEGMPDAVPQPFAGMSGNMTLIRYTGPRQGAFYYIGATSGRRYSFSQGESAYVLNEDVAPLQANREFEITTPAEPSAATVAMPSAPELAPMR